MRVSAIRIRGNPSIVMLLLLAASTGAQAACSFTSTTEWCFEQGAAAGTGGPENDDQLGAAVATGDFDGDGNLDIAIGAPGENGGAADGDGIVHVLYGDGVFPRAAGNTLLVPSGSNGRFGASLVADDIDGDGIDDLVVASPNVNISGSPVDCGFDGTCTNSGQVFLYLGSATGLSTSTATQLRPGTCSDSQIGDNRQFGTSMALVRGSGEGRLFVGGPGEQDVLFPATGFVCSFAYRRAGALFEPVATFGATLGGADDPRARYGDRVVAGRFSGSSRLDAAFAGPLADVASTQDTGGVIVTQGDINGDSFKFLQTDWPPAGTAADDEFGTGLANGDFNGDGREDIAVGTPYKDAGTGSPSNSGRIYIADGNNASTLVPGHLFSQGNLSPQTSEVDDNFGFALAGGSLDLDSFDDLIIGVPGEESGASDTNTGFVNVLHGSATGLTSTGPDSFRQSDIGGTNDLENRFGSVLATGDFNRDGVDEIIIGVPARTVAGHSNAGRVYIARQFSAVGGANVSVTFGGTTGTISRGAAVADTVSVTHLGVLSSISGATVHAVYPAGTGLGATPWSGNNWSCVPTVTVSATTFDCTSAQTLAIGAGTPSLTLNVTVSPTAPGTTFARTALAGSPFTDPTPANNAATLTATVAAPDLVVTKTHVGTFARGQVGATYTVTVTNTGAGDKAQTNLVSVVDTVPAGLTLTAMSGVGWNCTNLPTCTRSDLLPVNASYFPITVVVTVAADAASPQANSVAVSTAASESNAANNTATDSTLIDQQVIDALFANGYE